jgi:outer membrane protein assembly factor BamB
MKPEDQTKIKAYTKDSIIHFSSEKGVAIVNIFSGKLIYRSKQMIEEPWKESPRVITGKNAFTALNDSTFISIDVVSGNIKWKKLVKNIYNIPIIANDLVYVGGSKYFYAFNKDTGKEIDKYELGPFASSPKIISRVLYVWIEDRGLIAFDLNKRKIVWQKTQDRKDSEYQIIFENNMVFSNSNHLMASSLKDGKVLWLNDKFESINSYILTTTKNYVFAYKSVDDYSLLTASDKKTGKLLYEGFTTIHDDFKEPKPDRPLANLEGKHFRLGDKMYKNLLFAIDPHANIYCFEVKE